MDNIIKDIKNSFKGEVGVREKRPGIYQLFVPIYHEDGDMVDLYLDTNKGGYILCDFAHTLQRLSYSYDIDTPNKEAILDKILIENRMYDEDGNLCFPTKPATIFTDIMHVTQTYAKIGSMQYFKREVIENLFLEILNDYIYSELKEFNPQSGVTPLAGRTELEVDFQFSPNGYPVYLFAVKDANKAKLTTISCLEFDKANLNYRSYVVYENFDKLSKRDIKLVTNACDKQFTSMDEFKSLISKSLERERVHLNN
jgi:hypothetical protein